VQVAHGKWLLAEELYSKALALDPNNSDGLGLYNNLLAGVGRLKEAFAISQKLQTLEPFVPAFNASTAFALWLNGQNDAAIAMRKDLAGDLLVGREVARIYASTGRYREAADALLATPSGIYPPGMVEEAARLLRTAPATAASPQTLPRLGDLDFVYLHIGALGRVLEFYERNIDAGDLVASATASLWHPSYAPVRKTERFKAYVRRAGLVDYWRAKGWPEFCRPTTADDFVCD
jgi:tetratricopeptide (TPR) repeat protein